MRHSIISWDSSFRNFFHLLPSLAESDYDLSEVEVIFVEQRTQSLAKSVAEQNDIKPVHVVAEELKEKLDIHVVYLNEDDSFPYHPGRLLNAGLEKAKGRYLSTMDADILVPGNFLNVLDMVLLRDDCLVNLHRAEVPFPLGVSKVNWKKQVIDFQLLNNAIKPEHRSIPETVGNKAPLLSTRRENWEKIEFYDGGNGWCTACTLFGQDVSRRFKILLGEDCEVPLPVYCIHPWHPSETKRKSSEAEFMYSFQTTCIQYSESNRDPTVSGRELMQSELLGKYADHLVAAVSKLEDEMRNFTRPSLLVSK